MGHRTGRNLGPTKENRFPTNLCYFILFLSGETSGEGSPDRKFTIFRHIIFCPCTSSVGWETHFLAALTLLAGLAKGKSVHPRTTGMWKSFVTPSRLVEAVKGGT